MASRRWVAAGLPALLVACSTTPEPASPPPPMKVDLHNAQIHAQRVTAVLTAIGAHAVSAGAALSQEVRTEITVALATAQTANVSFQALQPGDARIGDIALAVLDALTKLLALLRPLLPALAVTTPAGMGLQIGIMVLTAFVAAVNAITAPA